MSALNDLSTAQGVDRYVGQKVSAEIARQRPAPRYAVVKGIDADKKIAEVSYIGEDSVVKVPYSNVIPNEVGQEVRIEGVPGDRYITAIRGMSADEAGILDLGENLETTKTDIADALAGNYAGEDSILNQIQEWAQSILGGGVGEFIGSIFTGGGLFNLGQLTSGPINLISYTGEFDLAGTVREGEGWSWDEFNGHTNPGSAKFSAAEAIGGNLTPPRPARVEPGKSYPVEVWVKWEDLISVNEAFAIDVSWYRSDRTLISTSVAASKISPLSNSDWVKLSGTVTAPSGAFWGAVFFRVAPTTSSGYVWFDDVGIFSDQASLPQVLIANLPEDLQNILGWLESLVDQLLGALGIPQLGSLFDKIADLSDEIESWFGDTQFLSGDFDDLVYDLLHNPVAVLGSLPQSAISGLSGIIGNFSTMFSQFSDIAQGLAVVPVNDIVSGFKDGFSGLRNSVSGVVQEAIDSAVEAVVDGLNGIGDFSSMIVSSVNGMINNIISSIFGDGGTKWGQEVLVASGPVTTGPNDIPLGFGMPFSGKITDLSFYSSDHLSTGGGSGATIEVRKNGSQVRTETWVGGNNSKNVTGLNISVSKYDRITFWVTSATSQLANMSISVMGTYV